MTLIWLDSAYCQDSRTWWELLMSRKVFLPGNLICFVSFGFCCIFWWLLLCCVVVCVFCGVWGGAVVLLWCISFLSSLTSFPAEQVVRLVNDVLLRALLLRNSPQFLWSLLVTLHVADCIVIWVLVTHWGFLRGFFFAVLTESVFLLTLLVCQRGIRLMRSFPVLSLTTVVFTWDSSLNLLFLSYEEANPQFFIAAPKQQ